jgi:hypothetical protein
MRNVLKSATTREGEEGTEPRRTPTCPSIKACLDGVWMQHWCLRSDGASERSEDAAQPRPRPRARVTASHQDTRATSGKGVEAAAMLHGSWPPRAPSLKGASRDRGTCAERHAKVMTDYGRSTGLNCLKITLAIGRSGIPTHPTRLAAGRDFQSSRDETAVRHAADLDTGTDR